MTEREALNRLIDHFRIHDDGRPTPYLDDAVSIAIKALKKQIPKKIVKHDKCPVCNNGQSTTWYYVGASYCEYCGQKLSWESDTD